MAASGGRLGSGHACAAGEGVGMLRRYFAGLSADTFLLALASLFADVSTEML